jgi:apolipoprotein N-acyltransferase
VASYRIVRIDAASLRPLQAAALGIAHTLAFAPWNLWWLQLLALVALFALVLRTESPREAAWLGFAFGIGWFGTGVSWVYISMHVYGQMWAWLAALATLAFAAFLATFPAAALFIAQRWIPNPTLRLLVGLPALWAAFEWLRGIVFTGFPWIVGGYAHTDGPLAGYAPLIGVYGITWVAAISAAAIVAVLRWRHAPRAVYAAFVIVSAALIGGAALTRLEWTQPAGAPIAVRLIQGNVPQDLKFGPDSLQRAHESNFVPMAGPGKFDLAVMPESVYPVPLAYLTEPVTRDLLAFVRERGALVFGIFIEERGQYYNSAVGLSADRAQAQRYSKRHLVPFGEFIPVGFRWFVDLMQIPIGDQERGEPQQPPMELAGQRIAVNICYEDLFGAEIIDAWADPARAPTLLLNISNLAWFGDSIALPQHLQISRMRALETGRPMLRATNTGATAIIDARGKVQQQLPFNTAGVLDGMVQGYSGMTPFVRYGNGPALVLIALLAAVAIALGRRRDRP